MRDACIGPDSLVRVEHSSRDRKDLENFLLQSVPKSESLAKDGINLPVDEDVEDNCSFDTIQPLDPTEGPQRFLGVFVQLTTLDTVQSPLAQR